MKKRPNAIITFVVAAITVASLAAFVGHRHHHFGHHGGCHSEREMSCESKEKGEQHHSEQEKPTVEKDTTNKL